MKDFFTRYDAVLIPEPNSGCLIWLGAVASAGYGHGHRDGVHFYAHRSAYEAVHGAGSLDGKFCLHRCDNPPCCNPDHLERGSQSDNMKDSFTRGRRETRARGTRIHTAKLNDDQVSEIRRRFDGGELIASIHRDYPSISKWDTIEKAATRKLWRHI